MPGSELDRVKSEFKYSIEKSFKLIQSINEINKEKTCFLQDQIYLIYELSFLRIFLAWEWFLERAFILYMIGTKTDSEYSPITYVNPRDENHAYNLVKGAYREYVDWVTPAVVIKTAELFFKDGEPFRSPLHNIVQDIQDMQTLRNAIVHISKESKEKFESLIRREDGYFSEDITPGMFLSGCQKSRNKAYITYFKESLEVTSDEIVK